MGAGSYFQCCSKQNLKETLYFEPKEDKNNKDNNKDIECHNLENEFIKDKSKSISTVDFKKNESQILNPINFKQSQLFLEEQTLNIPEEQDYNYMFSRLPDKPCN